MAKASCRRSSLDLTITDWRSHAYRVCVRVSTPGREYPITGSRSCSQPHAARRTTYAQVGAVPAHQLRAEWRGRGAPQLALHSHAPHVAMQALQWPRCKAGVAMQALQCRRCNAGVAKQALQCRRCNAGVATAASSGRVAPVQQRNGAPAALQRCDGRIATAQQRNRASAALQQRDTATGRFALAQQCGRGG